MKCLKPTLISLLLYAMFPIHVQAKNDTIDTMPYDTISHTVYKPAKENTLKKIWRGFNEIDEHYIEPQHYLYTVMLQGTYTYDYYTLRCNEKQVQSISFAPDGSLKIGPYLGWRWIFAGYTFTIGNSSYDKTKTEWDISLYSSQIGVDLFYRRTGSDYKLRNAHLGSGINTKAIDHMPFDGIKAGITGLNLYYIFNHKRFSYPAAFAQSTCQKVSCGSWMAGIGYTKNTLSFDYNKLQQLINDRLSPQTVMLDSGLMFKSAQYFDISISAGYAYNFVLAKNLLFCASGQLAMAYKESSGSTQGTEASGDHHFSFNKINPNVVGRFGLVYNNMRWYAGFSAIVRSNYYLNSRFSTNNTFGNMNMYVGYNFGLKKRYKKEKKL